MTRVHITTAVAAVTAALLASAPLGAQVGVRASTAAPQPSQGRDSDNEVIVVQGQKKEIAQALRQLIKPSGSEQFARFEDDVCPLVAGMPRDWTAVLTRMIRDNVVAVGGKLAATAPGRKCRVNAVVIFIDQPLELVKALAEAEPDFFAKTPREMTYFTATPRPVTSWHVTDTRDRDGRELGSVGSIGGAPADAKIVRNATASRLYSTIREDMLTGFVVIDRQATVGKSLRQLADLATMHLLLDVRQDAGARDHSSILSLFEPRLEGAASPRGMSRFDRGALSGFYTQRENNRSAEQQRNNIADAIRKGAGDKKE